MKESNGGREGESGRKREYEDGGKRASVGSFPVIYIQRGESASHIYVKNAV